jgi:hypothetical protein
VSVHVIPLEDLIAHELSRYCMCGPVDTDSANQSYSLRWYTHHSLMDAGFFMMVQTDGADGFLVRQVWDDD